MKGARSGEGGVWARIGTESHTHFADRLISRLAARQHGVVARWQLIEAGVSARQIKRRLDSGRLIQLHRGVYLAGTVAPAHAHEIAALLAYRLRAALSHRSAAQLWSLLPYPPPPGLGHGSSAATSAAATEWRSPARRGRSSTARR